MRSFAELSKTLGVLVGLWLVLLAVGYVGGVLPPSDAAPTTTELPDDADAAVAQATPQIEVTAEPEDAGVEPAEPDDAWLPEATDAGHVEEIAVEGLCAAGSSVLWALGDLVGDARDEIVVGCADHIVVVAQGPRGFSRVARVTPSQAASLRGAAVGDVDGDGDADLVVSLDRGLFLIPREASGALGPARVLAPAQNGAVALGALDATPGLDLAVVHGADPRAELWLYRGGPSPQRTRTAPAPVETSSLVVLDADVDGHLDVVAVGTQQVLIAFGDSRAGVVRTRSFTPGGRAALLADVDGDGEPEVLIERDAGPCVLDPSPTIADGAECAPLTSLEASVRALHRGSEGVVGLRRLDAAATPDVVRWSSTPEPQILTLGTLQTSRFGVHRVAELDEGLLLLGSSVDLAGARTIELARAPLWTTVHDAERRTDIVDAPLMLSITLPDSDTP